MADPDLDQFQHQLSDDGIYCLGCGSNEGHEAGFHELPLTQWIDILEKTFKICMKSEPPGQKIWSCSNCLNTFHDLKKMYSEIQDRKIEFMEVKKRFAFGISLQVHKMLEQSICVGSDSGDQSGAGVIYPSPSSRIFETFTGSIRSSIYQNYYLDYRKQKEANPNQDQSIDSESQSKSQSGQETGSSLDPVSSQSQPESPPEPTTSGTHDDETMEILEPVQKPKFIVTRDKGTKYVTHFTDPNTKLSYPAKLISISNKNNGKNEGEQLLIIQRTLEGYPEIHTVTLDMLVEVEG